MLGLHETPPLNFLHSTTTGAQAALSPANSGVRGQRRMLVDKLGTSGAPFAKLTRSSIMLRAGKTPEMCVEHRAHSMCIQKYPVIAPTPPSAARNFCDFIC